MVLSVPLSMAQQTIFNVPTTDVLERGQVYAELDAAFKPNNSEALGRFSSFVPRAVVGVGKHTEVGMNLVGNVQPGSDATTLVFTAKNKIYGASDNPTAVIIGGNLFVPLRNRSYSAGSYTYAPLVAW